MTEAMKTPSQPATGSAAMYGVAASIPDRTIIQDITKGFVDALYLTETNAGHK